VFFENSSCLRCSAPLGYLPDVGALVALDDLGDGRLRPVPLDRAAPGGRGAIYRRCANAEIATCNWLVPAPSAVSAPLLCASCALTRTRPNDADLAALAAFAKAESAKRRLLYQMADLGLRARGRAEDPAGGLAFDLLSSSAGNVVTGHARGVVTLDLAEGDDAYRERTRHELGEPYRTVLGHLRHEIAHYFWPDVVEATGRLDTFRILFGDERADYGAALEHHYLTGPPPDWDAGHVSSYATMHPFEDWAETFAHYLHIHDTMQSAGAAGMVVVGPRDDTTGRRDARLAAAPRENSLDDDAYERVIAEWLPLTYALNAVSRSMGRDDLYPFVLAPAVIAKLSFVHASIRAAAARLATVLAT